MRWHRTELGLKNDDSWLVGPPPSLDVLCYTYLRLKRDGQLPVVFYQGEPPDVRRFMDWYSQSEGRAVIVVGGWDVSAEEEPRFLGMGFVNAMEKCEGLTKAEVGFAFFKDVSIFQQISLMRAMISHLFITYPIDTILGTTPERNAGAVAMIRRLGMRLFGPMPNYACWHGQPCGVWLSQTDREHWFNLPENSELA